MKKQLFLLLAPALLLSACQPAPEDPVVIPKVETEATASLEQPEETQQRPEIYRETFVSTDGSVTYIMELAPEDWDFTKPIVEVRPYYLTEADNQRAAEALFGEAEFYENDRFGQEQYSRSELQQKIQRFTEYQGNNRSGYPLSDEVRANMIRECNALLEEAPETLQRPAADWGYRPYCYYGFSDEELAGMKPDPSREVEIKAWVNGISYRFAASTRKGSDFQYNGMSAVIDGGYPGWDDVYWESRISMTEKPSEAEQEAMIRQAEKTMSRMELGEWKAGSAGLREVNYGPEPQYQLHIKLLPSFGKIPTLEREQPGNLRGKDVYSSHYWLSEAEFVYGTEGQLIRFSMKSPLTIAETINPNAVLLPRSQLIQRAKQLLTLTDAETYGTILQSPCEILVDGMVLGLTRVKVPNAPEMYQYIPAVVFYGTVDFQEKPIPLLTLNAMDGTVINEVNS